MFSDLNSEFFSWIRGALLLLFLINAGLYIQNKKRLFFYYSFYLLFVFLFFLKAVIPEKFSEFYDFFGYSLFFLAFAFYVEFERVLLASKYTVPRWDRYLVVKKYFVIVAAIVLPIVNYFWSKEVLLIVVVVLLNLLNVFAVSTYIVISKIKHRNAINFIFGSVLFLVLGNIGMYIKFFHRDNLDALSFDPELFVYVGVMAEAFVFTNIMGNIFKQILERKSNLKVQFALKQKEAAELKMTALQSQMNPHFLFNSLNSINNYVLKSEKEEASDYITAFSKLVRKILKNSESLEISLFEEIEVLEMYLSLEKTRLSGGFAFVKSIDESLNLHDIMVPPLFLQPFFENSIWHGLANKNGDKIIELDIALINNKVVFQVIDNGIGIKKEDVLRNKKSTKRKFFGSYATEKRIKLMYESDEVEIFTKNISSKGKTGTKVTIIFPFLNKK